MTDLDSEQRAMLEVLLRRHPAVVALAELQAAVPDAAAEIAVSLLSADGLASRLDDRIGATRAAVRFAQLAQRR